MSITDVIVECEIALLSVVSLSSAATLWSPRIQGYLATRFGL